MTGREWLTDGGGLVWPRVILSGLVLAVLFAVIFAAFTSTTAFGLYNPAWDGATDLREQIEADPDVEGTLIQETAAYEDEDHTPSESVAFIIAPDDPYTDEDLERVQAFVEAGGTLVILENFGEPGATLLADVGAEARVDGQLLQDDQNYFRGPAMPIATQVEADHPSTAGVEQLTLNYATAIEPENATVLARTSNVTYLGEPDVDLDEVEDISSYPVATTENVSGGSVVAIGDPSLTTNAMLNEPDNAAFMHNIYADTDTVFLDVSHAGALPPLAGAMLTVRGSSLLQLIAGLGFVGLVAAASNSAIRSRVMNIRQVLPGHRNRVDATPRRLSTDELTKLVHREHPEWDDTRVNRVIEALERRRSEPADQRDSP